MRHIQTAALAVVVIVTVVMAAALLKAEDKAPAAAPQSARHVDLAICLDTSNSMDGLIESAKQKLWAVVNELATARPRPLLRVALYQYGNDGLSSENGWVQRVCELTDDLDTVYGKLFGLKTNGGTEYVARVIRAAAGELNWSADKDGLRIIFVAGNEPATQDAKFKLQEVCAGAIGKGIIVNTIFCGREQEGRNSGWADAARWADGRFAAIDQDKGTVAVATPYDQKLAELGGQLNKTYVAYGPKGQAGAANQVAQDANAGASGAPAAAQRVSAKASGLYRNAAWDLVDAAGEKDFDLAKVKEDALPEEMKKMNAEQRKDYLQQQTKRRADIQNQIKELSAQREAYARQEMARQGLSEKESFDAALRAAIRQQAQARNFTFENPPTTQPAAGK